MLALKLKQQGGFCDNAAIASGTSAVALCGMCTCLPSLSAWWMHPERNKMSKLTAILLFSRTVTAISKNKKRNKAGEQTNKQTSLLPIPRVALSRAGELCSNRAAS